MTCPQCAAEVPAADAFCPACGTKVGESAEEVIARERAAGALVRARKWLLACAILTVIGGAIFYAMQRSQVADEIAQARRATAGLTPEQRDQLARRNVGMTFEEALRHDEGMVTLNLATNLGLAVFFFAMWLWAKRNGVAATAIALMVFLTVHVVTAIRDPKMLASGIIFKIVFVVALVGALRAALEARRFRPAAA